MTIIHETEVTEVEHPGRFMRWLANENSLRASNLSVCVIRVMPGETVRPAHSHPNSEELIYIITGSGKVMIEGEVGDVRAGSAILFEQGKIHMLRNTGDVEMKVICFFAPATNVDNYKTFDQISFPGITLSFFATQFFDKTVSNVITDFLYNDCYYSVHVVKRTNQLTKQVS